jgi:hypothetical protein
MTNPRRSFILNASLAAIAAGTNARAAEPQAAPDAVKRLPPSVGRKFNADGSPFRFPGNTIISHIPLATPLSDALTGVRDTLAAGSYAHCLALLPPSSYHMTVFEGVTESSRRAGIWPGGLAPDAPLGQANRLLERRLEGFELDCTLPLRMRLDEFSLRRDPGATIRLLPLDEQENRKLRRLRDRLAAQLRLRAPDHDNYGFHISLAYLIDWMTPELQREYIAVQSECFSMLQKRVPLIELGAPEFCVFYDMFAFDTQFRVGQGRQRIPR